MTLHDILLQTLRVHPINYMTSTASILINPDLHDDWTNGSRIGKMVKRMIVTILMMNYCKSEDRLGLTGGGYVTVSINHHQLAAMAASYTLHVTLLAQTRDHTVDSHSSSCFVDSPFLQT